MSRVLWLRLQTEGSIATLAAMYPQPTASIVDLLTVAQMEWRALESELKQRAAREAEASAQRNRRHARRRGR